MTAHEAPTPAMPSLVRRSAAFGALLAAAALHGCAFEVRTIVVGDGAPLPDGDALDAVDEPVDVAPDLSVDAAPDVEIDAPDATIDLPPPDITPPDVTIDAPDVARETSVDVPEEFTTCAPGRVLCSFECVDLTTDATHCGGCSTRCTATQACVASRCVTLTRAGALCTNPDLMGGVDPACGTTLRCLPTDTTPWCSLECVDNTSQVTERSMCGGGQSTCLTIDEGMFADSRCTQACTPGASPGSAGACRAGYICTGWWFTRSTARSDTPGCAPFCLRDGDCPSGQRCNVRLGTCGVNPADLARLADGSPCDPTVTALPPGEAFRRNIQCRGDCFEMSDTDPTQGVCGSYLNLAASASCPDEPSTMTPDRSASPDDYAICLVRTCSHNSGCRSPLVCRYYEPTPGTLDRTSPPYCQYPTNAQRTGIP